MMVEALPVIIGILFVIISIRVVKKLILEVVWFGAILGGIEVWHYQATAILGLPPLPNFILVAGATAMVTWIFIRLIYVLSLFGSPLQPLFMVIRKFIEGK